MKKSMLALALGMALSGSAWADTTQDTTATTTDTKDKARNAATDLDAVSVIGSGESRQVQRIRPKDLNVLPPGTSVQKALNILPGVNAQSIDALGLNEQSLTMSLRGFNSTRLGYTLDGLPLGDSAYNNYNGLSISRALISENLGGAALAGGIGALGTASTSDLGGTVEYTTNDPAKVMGARVSQTFGSDNTKRSFARFDSGEYNGFSMYLSGMRATSDLFTDQSAYNQSTNKQFNGKAVYDFGMGRITAFVDTSRMSQADDFYLSKSELARGLGWDWGGYAPNWTRAVGKAYCNTATLNAKLCDNSGVDKDADGAFTAGQILRSDDLYYIAGDLFPTDTVTVHAQVYHHEDAGEGHNWTSGTWSNKGTPQALPLAFRNTLYGINRTGAILSASWEVGNHHIEGGVWYENNNNTSSRYTSAVTGPRDLSSPTKEQPDVGVFAQRTLVMTRQAYLQDTMKFLDDSLVVDVGVKSPHSTANARALPGVAKTPILPTSNNQFSTGKLSASKAFLPEAGVRYRIAQGQEAFVSYAQNIAMFQGGPKLGPQAVSQATWDSQGSLQPEKSRSLEAGYRIERDMFQASAAAYKVRFDNRLLQYNPCDSRQAVGPTCGNRFYNVGGVDSHGVELTFVWTPATYFQWYNSASFNRSTYANDYVQAGVVQHTKGKIQTDTPTKLFASEVSFNYAGWFASLRGKYTGKRYYTYTNDQNFGGYTTFDLGAGFDFGATEWAKDVRLSLNVTNLTGKRYASNLDSSAFLPSDPAGTAYVFHASAPAQVFGTLDIRF
ncbi:TonB-dependent receptor [Luteibacter sp. Sphag1AF]|uniref:TonB-dependent receptor n=1 Tax=Luteibacter sp. Sphag1AF TaxID=2587031 RepID=UPI001612D076|nr:TonB-dependent receptor [Luteibacter sp. Sphag1AF]